MLLSSVHCFRDHRSKHSDSREARGGPSSSQGTPTKPPGGPPAAGGGAVPRAVAGVKPPAAGGGLLGSRWDLLHMHQALLLQCSEPWSGLTKACFSAAHAPAAACTHNNAYSSELAVACQCYSSSLRHFLGVMLHVFAC